MIREFLDLIYPRECAVCGEMLESTQEWLCDECSERMPLTYFWSWRDNPAEEMLWGRTYLKGVISLYFYSKDNDFCELVHKLKYEGNIRLGKYLGKVLGEYIAKSGYPLPDYIVPVPVHWVRRYKRGYNQAEIIATGLQDGLCCNDGNSVLDQGIPILTNLLYRRKYTYSQVNMSMGNKWENAHGTFSLRSRSALNRWRNSRLLQEQLRGKHIFLVDDVLTSGATAEACYDVLRTIEDVEITLVTLAFVKR